MATGPRYRVPLRRRREGKTDYYLRRELLKSEKTRVVIRRSTKHIQVQFVDALPDGDVIKSHSSSYQLKEFGWDLTGGNIPASYLTGYLAAKKAMANGIEEGVLDLGRQTNAKGSRVYAALKGIIDAGFYVPANEKIFPEENIINGEHIAAAGNYFKEEGDYDTVFAKYKNKKANPEKLGDLVGKVKGKIDGKF